MLITIIIKAVKAASLCRTRQAWRGPRLLWQPPSWTLVPGRPCRVSEGSEDAKSNHKAPTWGGGLSLVDEEKVPVHEGSGAKQAPFLRSGTSYVGWRPMENGS